MGLFVPTTEKDDPSIFRTRVAGCPACDEWRRHTAAERAQYHSWAGHGYSNGSWSDPALGGTPPQQSGAPGHVSPQARSAK